MKGQDLPQNIPDSPGVYFFKKKGKILYIGKATSLKDRVRSYFSSDIAASRGPLITKMLEEATTVEYETTDSVLEALILEAALIRKYQPPYNTREKDDKSYNYVVITKEDYPRVFTVRARELQTVWDPDDITYTFGPFPHGGQLKEALRIIRKIFPFRGEKDALEPRKKRRSLLPQELGLVPDFSTLEKKEYAKTIRHIKLFFEGKKKQLLTTLEREMKHYAREKEFERAEEMKRQIFALEHIRDVSLIKEDARVGKADIRIESYDVAHTSGVERVGVMTVVADGRPAKGEYRKFKIRNEKGGDTGALKEILERRFEHTEWPLPKLIVVDGGKAQFSTAERVLQAFDYQIPIVAVTKNERHQPKRILGRHKVIQKYEQDILIANSEAHRFAVNYHRHKRRRLT